MAPTRVLISEVLILITNNMSHANIEKRLFFDVFFYNFLVSQPILFNLKIKIGMVKALALLRWFLRPIVVV